MNKKNGGKLCTLGVRVFTSVMCDSDTPTARFGALLSDFQAPDPGAVMETSFDVGKRWKIFGLAYSETLVPDRCFSSDARYQVTYTEKLF